MFPFQQRLGLAIGAKKSRRIEDPSIDELLKPALRVVIQHRGAPQGVEVAIGIKAQLGGAVISVGQLLAGITQRLKVADGVGMLQSGHERGWPSTHCGARATPLCGMVRPENRTWGRKSAVGWAEKATGLLIQQ